MHGPDNLVRGEEDPVTSQQRAASGDLDRWEIFGHPLCLPYLLPLLSGQEGGMVEQLPNPPGAGAAASTDAGEHELLQQLEKVERLLLEGDGEGSSPEERVQVCRLSPVHRPWMFGRTTESLPEPSASPTF